MFMVLLLLRNKLFVCKFVIVGCMIELSSVCLFFGVVFNKLVVRLILIRGFVYGDL